MELSLFDAPNRRTCLEDECPAVVFYGRPGVLSRNEEFAVKKNLGEDARLMENMESISIEKRFTTQMIKDHIKTLKQELKEIRSSTGKSPDGIRTLSSRTLPDRLNSLFTYHVPKLLKARVMSGKSEKIERETAFTQVDKILRGKSALIKTGFDEKVRVQSSDGYSKSDHQNKKDRRKVKSEGHLDSSFSGASDEVSYEGSVFSDGDDVDDNDKEDGKKSKGKKCLRTLYNPWNIQKRDGVIYNALELPKIKDCHRLACRPNCNTCSLRKKKGPCFLIPGLVHFHENPGIENESKQEKKKKVKKKKDTYDNHIESEIDQERQEVDELQELLKKKHDPIKSISISRLRELSVPKGGFRRELRFSKSYLKRSVNRMVELNKPEQLTYAEKENLRRIQSKITMFLAYINLQQQDVQPKTMVHIPIRDDIMKGKSSVTHVGQTSIVKERQNSNRKHKIRRRVAFL